MSKIAMCLLSFFTSMAFAQAQVNFGRKINPATDQSGTPSIGIQYGAQATKMVVINVAIQGRDLVGSSAQSIAPAQWAILDKTIGAQLSKWTDLKASAALIDPNSTQAFSVAVGSLPEIQSVIGSLKDSVIAIAVKDGSAQPTPSVYIDLGELCLNAPGKFLNMDTFSQGCN